MPRLPGSCEGKKYRTFHACARNLHGNCTATFMLKPPYVSRQKCSLTSCPRSCDLALVSIHFIFISFAVRHPLPRSFAVVLHLLLC